MDLVLRVFNTVIIIIFLNSCVTDISSNGVIVKKITIDRKIENKIDDEMSAIPNTNKKIEVKNLISGSISTTCIIENDLWVGKLGGELIRYNLYTNDSKLYFKDNYTIKDFSIKKILELEDRILILQSDRVSEIFKSDSHINITQFPVDINRATDICVYKNRVFISTLGYGLWQYNVNTGTFLDFIPDIKYISSLKINKNTMFIGTMDSGLYSYNLITKKINSRLNYPLALFNKNILSLQIKDNILWLGTSKNGLIKWNTFTNKVERIHKGQTVSSIFLGDKFNAVSFIGLGIYIEANDRNYLESISTILQTNNITSVKIFNKSLITGNIKKGIIKQEMIY